VEIVVPPLDQENGKADTFSGLGGQDRGFQIGRGLDAVQEKLGRHHSSLYVCVCYTLANTVKIYQKSLLWTGITENLSI
jgi:hypothetical protein